MQGFATFINGRPGKAGLGVAQYPNVPAVDAIPAPSTAETALVELHRILFPRFSYVLDQQNPPHIIFKNNNNPAIIDGAQMEEIRKHSHTVKTHLPVVPQALRDTISRASEIASLMSISEEASVCTPETAHTLLNNFTRKSQSQWQTMLECMTPEAPPANYSIETEHVHMFRKMPKHMKVNVRAAIARGTSHLGNTALNAAGHGLNAFDQQFANTEMQYLENLLEGSTIGHSQAEVMLKSGGQPRHKKRTELNDGMQAHLNALDDFSYKASKRVKNAEPMTRA
jgi:hypothetical protein